MTDKANTYSAKSPLGDLGVMSPLGGADVGVNMFYNAPRILFEFAKSNRENPTKAEEYLWKYLSGNKLKEFHFRRQHPIKYFIADFYCHKAKLIIEIDGGYHTIPEQYEYDRARDNELEELGIKILRFTNEQVFHEIDGVLETINKALHKAPFRGGGGAYGGVVVPMITPLTKDLQIDTNAVNTILSKFAENNISPLVLGTTGESSSVGKEASALFVETAVKAKQANQTIYAGLVGNNVQELIERAKLYADLGADAVVSTLPSYYILTPQQMELFYTQLADNTPCPVMMYNIKATTQMTIPLDVVEKLSYHPNITGLKDSERDAERLKTCINQYRDRADFSFFCGWGAQGLRSLQMGADGIVPSTGNIVPELYKELYDAFQRKENDLAEEVQRKTDEVAVLYQKNRTLGESLAVLKVMMEKRGWCQRYMMPPLTPVDYE